MGINGFAEDDFCDFPDGKSTRTGESIKGICVFLPMIFSIMW
jgi:hypothetical protein